VHTTQFGIRDAGLYEPVLRTAAETVAAWSDRPVFLIAGLVGGTAQALREADVVRGLGYHAGLLSLAGMQAASEDELIAHCAAVAATIPLVGFYLQPAVGGIVLPVSFWRRFATIDNVIAIKIAPFNRYRTQVYRTKIAGACACWLSDGKPLVGTRVGNSRNPATAVRSHGRAPTASDTPVTIPSANHAAGEPTRVRRAAGSPVLRAELKRAPRGGKL
jgi:hypothetical protein